MCQALHTLPHLVLLLAFSSFSPFKCQSESRFSYLYYSGLQSVDLPVVKKQKSTQLLFPSQAANNKGWENFFLSDNYSKPAFPLDWLAEAGRQRALVIARARRALGQMGLLGTFSSWAELLFCFSSFVVIEYGFTLVLIRFSYPPNTLVTLSTAQR